MKFKFKAAHKKDLPTILDNFKRAAQKIAEKGIDHWQYWHNPPADKIRWVEEGIANREFFFVENSKGKRVGMVRILNEDNLYWGKQPDKAKYVHSLVITEDYNGRGFGKTILKQIEHQARDQNCAYLRLDCAANNPKLCRYYEKQGFKKVGQTTLSASTYNLYQKKVS